MPSASACLAYDTPQAFGTFGVFLLTPTLPLLVIAAAELPGLADQHPLCELSWEAL